VTCRVHLCIKRGGFRYLGSIVNPKGKQPETLGDWGPTNRAPKKLGGGVPHSMFSTDETGESGQRGGSYTSNRRTLQAVFGKKMRMWSQSYENFHLGKKNKAWLWDSRTMRHRIGSIIGRVNKKM